MRFRRLAVVLLAFIGANSPAQRPGAAISVILGRPTDRAVTLNLLSASTSDVFVEYGTAAGVFSRKTSAVKLASNQPHEIVLDSLQPNTSYSYRVAGVQGSFHTQRPPGSAFTFLLQADPHLDDGTDPEVYKRSLRGELSSSADFLIDLGDTFMSDKLESPTRDDVVQRHLMARTYYDLVTNSLPLFLTLGNHEGETSRRLNGTAENLAVWASNARRLYYPNPEPNGFYSGSTHAEPFIGLRQNYYWWTWGDALFIVLDPFWYTAGRRSGPGDNWDFTLGREQYDWLKSALEQSRARFKFVFAHNLVGGLDLDGRARGGIEGAPYFEWGGHNQDGTWGFAEKRPGWPMPIHQLLVRNNVTAFFHGHDHLYARQELDGVVYQEVPQPSHGGARNPKGEYAYTHGDILPGSGYLRIRVAPDGVRSEFLRTDAGAPQLAHTYSLAPRAQNDSASPTTQAGSTVAPAPAPDPNQPPRKGGKLQKGGAPQP